MKGQVPLRVRNRFVKLLFALPDNNEKALTYALGYAIANSELLRNKVLRHALHGIPRGQLNVDIERACEDRRCERQDGSRYDVRISVDGRPRVIIEGKIGRKGPEFEQCLKYVQDLRAIKPHSGRQSLLLVFDKLEEDAFNEQICVIKEQIDCHLRQGNDRMPWRGKAEHYFCRPLTWGIINEWCEGLISKTIDDERRLLEDYCKYLDLDRYAHYPLRGSGPVRRQSEDLECIVSELEQIAGRLGPSTIEMIPLPGRNERLYIGVDDGSNEAFIGYRISANHVFGVVFKIGESETYMYFHLPNGLPTGPRLKRYYRDREKNGQACVKYPGEYWFKVEQDRGAVAILDELEQAGFFGEAIKQAR